MKANLNQNSSKTYIILLWLKISKSFIVMTDSKHLQEILKLFVQIV